MHKEIPQFKPDDHAEKGESRHIVRIKPREITEPELEKIRPQYRLNKALSEVLDRIIQEDEEKEEELAYVMWAYRHPGLDETDFADDDGTVVRPKEIADYNYSEEERATAQKWYCFLNQLFHHDPIQTFPLHRPDGRMQIAIPGCLHGFEIGGIVDFFNEQGIAVDIRAVDELEAGSESQFLRLDQRLGVMGSTVSFHSETDARTFYDGTKQDLVVFRHPGPLDEQFQRWQAIFRSLLSTEPAMVILSTDRRRIVSPEAKRLFGRTPGDSLNEIEVFQQWLESNDYSIPEAPVARIADDRLRHPLSIYMAPYRVKGREGGEIHYDVPFDREIFIATRKGAFLENS